MYKLMVVGAFESFKRGDYIYDQEMICKIYNPNDLMHGYIHKVRKMYLTEKEKQQYLAPKPNDVIESPVKAQETPIMKMESIKDERNKPSKSKGE
jgi:hypothetical protein